MIIQIYEVGNPAEAKKLAKLGVDHIGVLVGEGEYPRELNIKQTVEIFRSTPKEVKRVALSLSNNIDDIAEIVKKTNPDILHLGTTPESLSPDDIMKLKKTFPKLEIMRSIPIVGEESVELAKKYDGIADYLLLDSRKKGDTQVGATGEIHDWSISERIVKSVNIPVILAGGLGPDNVAEAIEKVKPAGVDSKTKTDKTGSHEKDINKVESFVKIVKYIERFTKLYNLFTEAYLTFYVWKGLQDKTFEPTFSENKNFWSAVLLSLQNNWLTSLAKIYEDSKYSKTAKIISVYALLPYQTNQIRATKVQNILKLNNDIIKNIKILRDHQLAHNNAEHLLKPKAILSKFPIKYSEIENLLLSSGEILSNLDFQKERGYDYKMLAEDSEHDGKNIIKKLQYYSKLLRKHLEKLKRGEIKDYHFPPDENLTN